jgi:hypothetical protein
VVGSGHVAGQRRDRLPLCVDCLTLLLKGVRPFWEEMTGCGER